MALAATADSTSERRTVGAQVIACDLIAAAPVADAPCAWVLADSLYGWDSRLRRMLEARRRPYGLALRSNQVLRLLTADGLLQNDPAGLADALPCEAWAAHAAGEASKGLRLYDWARIALPWTVDEGFERWLLIRRNRRDASKQACYLVLAPTGAGFAELAGAAGLRWTIEECFQRAKEELGLDRCEARSWRGWHRHMTLCMASLAFLGRALGAASSRRWRQTERKESACSRGVSRPMFWLLSVPEIRTLIARLLLPPIARPIFILAWSGWRRGHQLAAAQAHYRARQNS